MPVDSVHDDYAEALSMWDLLEDFNKGSRAVKAAGPKYLPRLNWKKNPASKYETYKFRAVFSNATRKTSQALLNLVFRKPPVMLPEGLAETELAFDASDSGVTLMQHCFNVVKNQINFGRVGILVDSAESTPGVNGRVYQSVYKAKDIRNWFPLVINGKKVLGKIVLREYPTQVGKDEFERDVLEVYRVVDLVPAESVMGDLADLGIELPDDNNGYVLRHRLMDVVEKRGKKIDRVLKTMYPHRRKLALDFVPFIVVNVTSCEFDEVEESILYDMAEVNLSQYMNSADLENGRHFTGLPQPYIWGITAKPDEVFEIGAEVAWTSPNHNINSGYMEFMGEGLKSLEKAIEEKSKMMISLGSQMLEERQVSSRETATTSKIKSAAQASLLGLTADIGSEGLSRATAIQRWWSDGGTVSLTEYEKDTKISLNRDYDFLPMTGDEAVKWSQLKREKHISHRTFFDVLKRGEVYAHDMTLEKELSFLITDINTDTGADSAQEGNVA